MTWDDLVGEIVRRGWHFTIDPAYLLDGVSGTRVVVVEFDPHDTAKAHCAIVPLDNDCRLNPKNVLAAALRLCREVDAGFLA